MPPPDISLSLILRLPNRGEAAPVVFDSPHSGMEWPPDFKPAAPRSAILTTWDAYVDELWSGAPDHGATLLSARFPRAYIDANRAADDLDPALINDGPWPGPLAPTDYSRRGMGLVRRFALPGVPMYDRPLASAEVQHRLETYYQPYRIALKRQLDELHATCGAVWHVNCHSMKPRGNSMNLDDGSLRPDIVVSDRNGRTASPDFTRWAADWFSAHGFVTKVNNPYLGGDLVATHGDPSVARHSIQIEINRALYLEEPDCTRKASFAELQQRLDGFAAALCAFAKEHMTRRVRR